MTNGKATVTLDELLAGMNGKHGTPLPLSGEGADLTPGPSPARGGVRRRRGPDARDRLSADQAHERAIAVLHVLRGLTRVQQRRVLARALALLER